MKMTFPIVLVLSILSIVSIEARPAHADDHATIERCATQRFDENTSKIIGLSLKRLKRDPIDIPDTSIVVEPRLAGLKGPALTLYGRDVRLAVVDHQTSPQELWHKGVWNHENQSDHCEKRKLSWTKSLARGLYRNFILDNTVGFSSFYPRVLYRSRNLAEIILVRPFGFTFGGTLSVPMDNNTENLLTLPQIRDPIRSDLARFSNSIATERLYASWRYTPITDFHVAVTGGWLEEMYAGFGGEALYRPFGSPFWFGMDAWQLWRRNPTSSLNMDVENNDVFTGHVRVGYDVPNTRYNFSLSAGRYLATDHGITANLGRTFENGARFDATMTWTNRRELEGFFEDTTFDPMFRITWPLGQRKNTYSRTHVRQIGRDTGQMIDRPLPLEKITETFSMREVVRHWPNMFK